MLSAFVDEILLPFASYFTVPPLVAVSVEVCGAFWLLLSAIAGFYDLSLSIRLDIKLVAPTTYRKTTKIILKIRFFRNPIFTFIISQVGGKTNKAEPRIKIKPKKEPENREITENKPNAIPSKNLKFLYII